MDYIAYVNEYIQTAMADKTPIRPNFYITYGPPASGKSTIMNKVAEIDHIIKKGVVNAVSVDLDRIISNYPDYKNNKKKIDELDSNNLEKVYKCLQDETKKRYSDKGMHDKKKILSQELYWSIRKLMNNVSDQLLDTALLNKSNIIWETTGSAISWTAKEINRIKSYGYDVTILYPYVPSNILVERALKRFKDTGQESAPEEQIRENATKSQQNLIRLINIVDRVFIYDNSGKPGQEKLIICITHSYNWCDETLPGCVKSDHVSDKPPGHNYVVTCGLDVTHIKTSMNKELVDTIERLCKSKVKP
jgi:predicted ABC-type ATPase